MKCKGIRYFRPLESLHFWSKKMIKCRECLTMWL